MSKHLVFGSESFGVSSVLAIDLNVAGLSTKYHKILAQSGYVDSFEISERKQNHSNMESKVDQNWAFDAFNDGSISTFVQLLLFK